MNNTEENFDPMTCSFSDLQAAIKHYSGRLKDPAQLRRAGFLRGVALMRSPVAETERAVKKMGTDSFQAGWYEGILHAKVVLQAAGIVIK